MAVYTYQVNENNRLVADYDNYPAPYSDFIGDDVQVFVLDSHRGNYDGITKENEFADAFRRFSETYNYWSHDDYRSRREEAISRYLRLRGLRGIFKTLQGYSQSEWANVVIYSTLPDDNDYLEHYYDTLDKWFKGEVYTISLERREVFTSVAGNTLDVWHEVEAIGGCLLENGEESLRDYLENFYIIDEPIYE